MIGSTPGGGPANGDADACGDTDQLGMPRPFDGVRGRDCDIKPVEFYPVVNDLVLLEHMRTQYVPPDADDPNPLAPGGEYRIEAQFENAGSHNLQLGV
jgi:hypothetical protein